MAQPGPAPLTRRTLDRRKTLLPVRRHWFLLRHAAQSGKPEIR